MNAYTHYPMNTLSPLLEKRTEKKITAGVHFDKLPAADRGYLERLIGNIAGFDIIEHPDTSELALYVADAASLESSSRILTNIRMQYPMAVIALFAKREKITAAITALKNGLVDRLLFAGENPRKHQSDLLACFQHYHNHQSLVRDIRPRIRGPLFITGASGFLGGCFVAELLRCTDTSVVLLSRTAKGKLFNQRFSNRFQGDLSRISILEGDITLPNAGLPPSVREHLSEIVEDVWHFAAATGFDEMLRPLLFNVNLKGTQNLLQLCSGFRRLQCFNHISTAYVAGRYSTGKPAPERIQTDLRDFNNAYEESKYQAEHAVAQSGLPYRIYRPGIVMGHTLTGENDGKSVYTLIKMVRMAKLLRERETARGTNEKPFRVLAHGMASKNLIPVDIAIEMMLRIAAFAPPVGSVFHITNPYPVSMEVLVRKIASVLCILHYELVDELKEADGSNAERLLQKLAKVYRPYMQQSDPVFDQSNTRRYARAAMSSPLDDTMLSFLVNNFLARENYT